MTSKPTVAIAPSLLFWLAFASTAHTATFFPATGHYYDFVVFNSQGEKSWTISKAEAESKGGYLVTVTTAAEQAFLESLGMPSGSWWAGGSDAAAEGTWRWETGPETGTQFWQGFSNGNTTAPFFYANWLAGEPNSTNEDYLAWNRNSGGAGWNDVSAGNSVIRGYLVEFNTNPVPEPSTLLVAVMAMSCLCLQISLHARNP